MKSEDPFIAYLSALYADRPPDLIVAIGAPAGSFVLRHRTDLFPNVPMVLTAVEQRRVDYSKLTENDTVVAAHNDVLALFQHILDVLPDTKTIAIVNGASANERPWKAFVQKETMSLANRVRFKWYDELSFEDILKDASHLPRNSAIFWLLMNVDAAGVVHEGRAALMRLAAVANAPIFTHDEAYFGDGILGGPMQSVTGLSKVAADVARRVLDGEKAGSIKTPPVPLAPPKYDWRRMHQFALSQRDLPRGSEVFFRPPSAWDTYRWQLITVLVAFLLQGAVILLLLERHRRRTAEMESQQRMVELAHVARFSTAGEMAASIAHEINQPLGAILNNVETAEIMLRSGSPDLNEIREVVGDIRRDNTRAADVIRHLRSYVKKVPSKQRLFDLNDEVAEALKFLSPEARARGVVLRSKLARVPLPVRGDPIQLEQVLSNLILNAMDAMAEGEEGAEKVVTVETGLDRKCAEVAVSDTGPGVAPEVVGKLFDPFYSTKEHGMGLGLSIVRSIVEAHKGEIAVESKYHGGAVFRVKLPLA